MGSLNKRFPHYSRLLRLYPTDYHREYGEQMLQTLADMLDNTTPSKRWLVWVRATVDLPFSAIHQQLTYEGAILSEHMPNYIKRNGTLGAWLVAPFFVFLILSAFTSHALNNSFFWHTRVLFVWLILLPGVAVILNLAALLRWVQSRRKASRQNVWRTLIDIRYSWPAIAAIIVGLGILALVFGHDSVHCVTGNPVRELHNPHATLRCIQQR